MELSGSSRSAADGGAAAAASGFSSLSEPPRDTDDDLWGSSSSSSSIDIPRTDRKLGNGWPLTTLGASGWPPHTALYGGGGLGGSSSYPQGTPLPAPNLYQQQLQVQQQQQQQQQQGGFGSCPLTNTLQQGRPPPAYPAIAAMPAELQRLLTPEDRQTLQHIATRARASALVASFGLGFFAWNLLKKKNWRYPIVGASLVGVTFGPPLGFAGYMLLNYSKVQQMERRFREIQASFEQQRRGLTPPMSGGLGYSPYFAHAPGQQENDLAAETAEGWPSPDGTSPPSGELLAE